MTYGSHECNTSQIIIGYSAGVLRLANTEQFTSGGAFQEDLKLDLEY